MLVDPVEGELRRGEGELKAELRQQLGHEGGSLGVKVTHQYREYPAKHLVAG